jgi:hypothetical protein
VQPKVTAGGAPPRGTKPPGSLLLANQRAESNTNRFVYLLPNVARQTGSLGAMPRSKLPDCNLWDGKQDHLHCPEHACTLQHALPNHALHSADARELCRLTHPGSATALTPGTAKVQRDTSLNLPAFCQRQNRSPEASLVLQSGPGCNLVLQTGSRTENTPVLVTSAPNCEGQREHQLSSCDNCPCVGGQSPLTRKATTRTNSQHELPQDVRARART